MIIVDPVLALSIGLVLGLAYTLVFKATSKLLSRIGKERVEANEARFISLNEAFGAAKEIKLGRLEEVYIRRFSVSAETYSRHLATATIIGNLPRFMLELIAFGGILLVILYLMNQGGNFSTVIPVVSLYALAGYRLMPALQQIYSSATQLRFSGSALDAILAEFASIKAKTYRSDNTPLPLLQAITLNNITYHYLNLQF